MLPLSHVFRALRGQWQISRTISPGGRFTGRAEFVAADDKILSYSETGALALDSGNVIRDVSRRYQFVLMDDDKISVLFADGPQAGKLFHTITPEGTGVAACFHHCGQDDYLSYYDFVSLPNAFTIRHQVKGPKKDYNSTSFYMP